MIPEKDMVDSTKHPGVHVKKRSCSLHETSATTLTSMQIAQSRLPSRLVIVAGTYDGVLVGWDTKAKNNESRGTVDGHSLGLKFAVSDAHEGSVRSVNIGSYCPASSIFASTTRTTGSKRKKTKHNVGEPSEKVAKQLRGEESIISTSTQPLPGILVSTGFDESIRIFHLEKNMEIGEARTPPDLGTPCCSSLIPPNSTDPTHLLVGLSSGKLVLYETNKDWSIVHVLPGHDKGSAQCIACHPTGKMALTGGRDGTIRLWDLMRGRLSYVHRVNNDEATAVALPPADDKESNCADGNDIDDEARKDENSSARSKTIKSTSKNRRRRGPPVAISKICWSHDGSTYAYSFGSVIVARDLGTGECILEASVPSRPNDIGFLFGKNITISRGSTMNEKDQNSDRKDNDTRDLRSVQFLAVACDDGALAVFATRGLDDDADVTRAIMAIEGVDENSGRGARDERYKCIRPFPGGSGYLAATANTGGIISIVDLQGAVNILSSGYADSGSISGIPRYSGDGDRTSNLGKEASDNVEECTVDDDEEDEDVAAEILESVRVGSGARITDISVWSCDDDAMTAKVKSCDDHEPSTEGNVRSGIDNKSSESIGCDSNRNEVQPQRKGKDRHDEGLQMDAAALERAGKLVKQAKRKQKRKKEKNGGLRPLLNRSL